MGQTGWGTLNRDLEDWVRGACDFGIGGYGRDVVKCAAAIRFKADAEALEGLGKWEEWLKKPNDRSPETWWPKKPDYQMISASTENSVLHPEYAEGKKESIVGKIDEIKNAHPYRKVYLCFSVQGNKQSAIVSFHLTAPN